MRPPSPPPARWLCVLAGALACALGPAGGRAARLQQECDYLQMIEVQHKECLEEAQLENETAGCSKMWDNLTCWPATPRGQVVVLACPLIFKLFSPIQAILLLPLSSPSLLLLPPPHCVLSICHEPPQPSCSSLNPLKPPCLFLSPTHPGSGWLERTT
ncbi:Hypothetical predicted protein [Marmota monax]|uniref:G-protein coupled receptors family 2 profile 1 domain-containing protein n=1 Tax=Marmota monax TaxID=9995 RepID=A0A5E4AL64_MARMO|nr:hypothetical protein GHT09_011783 [Marmota monax]VTJ57491.1 Hypothetical predicted protein [Marmota monax]